MHEHRNSVAWLIAALLGVLGCPGSSSSTTTPSPSTDGGTSTGSCTNAADCAAGQVCAPATKTCTAELSCSAQSDCGQAAFCGTDGRCAPSTVGSPCTSNDNCLSGHTCVGGFCGCKGESYTGQRVTGNVLIVLDRSNSMTELINGGSKWAVAKQAIKDLLAARGGEIRFGLAVFPGTDQACTVSNRCLAGAVFVDIGEGTAASINSFLEGANTCVGTPMAETLTVASNYAGLKDTTRANYILLITDGVPSCADPVAAVTTLRNQTPEVKTFVVGFGSGVDANVLNAMAQQGGTAFSGTPPYYYVAGDAASLASAFSSIAGSVLSCSYTLSTVPQDLNQLYVYQAKKAIARDTARQNGWDFDTASNQLTFYGEACQALTSGQVSDLSIVYGCPMSVD